MLLWTWLCKYLLESVFSPLCGIYPEVELLDHIIILFTLRNCHTIFHSSCTILQQLCLAAVSMEWFWKVGRTQFLSSLGSLAILHEGVSSRPSIGTVLWDAFSRSRMSHTEAIQSCLSSNQPWPCGLKWNSSPDGSLLLFLPTRQPFPFCLMSLSSFSGDPPLPYTQSIRSG